MQNYKIKRKSVSQITTKFGLKERHSFLLEDPAGDFWASCFANPVTASWKEGESYNMDIEDKEHQGKIYRNIVIPKNTDTLDGLKKLDEKMNQILDVVRQILNILTKGTTSQFDEVPPPDDNIPF